MKEGEQPAQPVDKGLTAQKAFDMTVKLLEGYESGDLHGGNPMQYIERYAMEKVMEAISPSPERGESDGWIKIEDCIKLIRDSIRPNCDDHTPFRGACVSCGRHENYDLIPDPDELIDKFESLLPKPPKQ